VQKIISLFQQNYDGDRLVRNEVVPGAEWVVAGEGAATRKFDGTCCLVRDGRLYKRCEVKPGSTPPPDFEPAGGVDEVTGKQQGWLPVGDGPQDRWHREAWEALKNRVDGTAELVGPKVQGNPENESCHMLLYHHLADPLPHCPRDFEGIKAYLATAGIEGVVWHHPDGRMVKIKAKDFGLKRKKSRD